ncbi:uncharacterized protein LACBIDRAFT_310758 [Laccaria bicolor S238N-H82]|uniref:Predicted protein n=1 Tax=Laccaria bicolor (strain S238N-H82 / ATCC MYA-4686) TaxID=486041 RepID=B0DV17_LACBS|nr:uncharacterized protein LACBIDRAFT_310758 [Laccaria bicolor S238N-H82]EDR01710.1 predicted protein [Laccaria bicolor S238N-H82]|eukprot:XP_001887786.1 predicted protein [Laccaria bicolor S238N-H82]
MNDMALPKAVNLFVTASWFDTHMGMTGNNGPIGVHKVSGELALHNVTFTYPSRPTIPGLSNVSSSSLQTKSRSVIGSSASVKSTVAQLIKWVTSPSTSTTSSSSMTSPRYRGARF